MYVLYSSALVIAFYSVLIVLGVYELQTFCQRGTMLMMKTRSSISVAKWKQPVKFVGSASWKFVQQECTQ